MVKQYSISLTIADEENGEQIIQLRAPHLTGKQVHDLTQLSIAGVTIEPDPVIHTTNRKEVKKKRRLFQREPSRVVPTQYPDGFTPKDLKV